ncbi:MAG: DUF4111 domain-containing protein [Clostridia bacterium]|nr:DUF4111 domain-containing protein [Clostridia bacterium]
MTDEKRAWLLLEEIKDACIDILGDRLTGIYVHGSLAFGCFTWATGDIDFLIVAQHEMTQAEKEALIRLLLGAEDRAPSKGFEMSVMRRQDCEAFVHPAPYELHYSKAYRREYQEDLSFWCRKMCGVDEDLAAHITVLKAVGKTLYGPPLEQVFGDVPPRDYLKSILFDVENAREDVWENPVYVTLNLCRVLGYMKERLVLSKKTGALWGMENLPSSCRTLIRGALACYEGNKCEINLQQAADFADYALRQIEKMTQNDT